MFVTRSSQARVSKTQLCGYGNGKYSNCQSSIDTGVGAPVDLPCFKGKVESFPVIRFLLELTQHILPVDYSIVDVPDCMPRNISYPSKNPCFSF